MERFRESWAFTLPSYLKTLLQKLCIFQNTTGQFCKCGDNQSLSCFVDLCDFRLFSCSWVFDCVGGFSPKSNEKTREVNYSSKFIQQITVSVPWIQIISLIFCTKKGGSATDLQLIFLFNKILWCSCPDSQHVQNHCVPSIILHSASVSWEKCCSRNWYLVYKKRSQYHWQGFLCLVMWHGMSSPQIIDSQS